MQRFKQQRHQKFANNLAYFVQRSRLETIFELKLDLEYNFSIVSIDSAVFCCQAPCTIESWR